VDRVLVEVFTADGVFYVVAEDRIVKSHVARHSSAKEQAAVRDRRRG
jgi:hypothetical protein